MANPTLAALLERLRTAATMQRSIGLNGGADLLDNAAKAIDDLDARNALLAAVGRHPAGKPEPRTITTREEAFALAPGTVLLNDSGDAFQIKLRRFERAGIDHHAAAFLLPLTVIHEGRR